MLARIITELLLWVLLEFTGYGQLADIGEFLRVDTQVTHPLGPNSVSCGYY